MREGPTLNKFMEVGQVIKIEGTVTEISGQTVFVRLPGGMIVRVPAESAAMTRPPEDKAVRRKEAK